MYGYAQFVVGHGLYAMIMEITMLPPKKISILIPSKRPTGLITFIDSLRRGASMDNGLLESFQLIVGIDNEAPEPTLPIRDVKIVRCEPKRDISYYFESCYRLSDTEWNFFANDDLICQTYGWDQHFLKAIDDQDNLLIWPDDKILGKALACFPLVHQSVTDKLFPLPPYKKYKVDDSIMDCVPFNRRCYLSEVTMLHNNPTDYSHLMGNKFYPSSTGIEMIHDTKLFNDDTARRMRIRNELEIT